MNSIISAHNCSSLNPPKNNYGCNCRDNTNYSLQNLYLTTKIAHEADDFKNVDNGKRVYLGAFEIPFKEIYSNYVKDDKHERYSNATELSKYV